MKMITERPQKEHSINTSNKQKPQNSFCSRFDDFDIKSFCYSDCSYENKKSLHEWYLISTDFVEPTPKTSRLEGQAANMKNYFPQLLNICLLFPDEEISSKYVKAF